MHGMRGVHRPGRSTGNKNRTGFMFHALHFISWSHISGDGMGFDGKLDDDISRGSANAAGGHLVR